jgi:hypothetical protein
MSAAVEIQRAIYNALRNDASVAGLLAVDPNAGSPTMPAVFDHVPQSATPEAATSFPYVALGATTEGEFDTDDQVGRETTFTIHTWSRKRGLNELKQVMDAIKSMLHNGTLTVSGETFVFCYQDFAETMLDPDGMTRHGVQRFRIVTQGH